MFFRTSQILGMIFCFGFKNFKYLLASAYDSYSFFDQLFLTADGTQNLHLDHSVVPRHRSPYAVGCWLLSDAVRASCCFYLRPS